MLMIFFFCVLVCILIAISLWNKDHLNMDSEYHLCSISKKEKFYSDDSEIPRNIVKLEIIHSGYSKKILTAWFIKNKSLLDSDRAYFIWNPEPGSKETLYNLESCKKVYTSDNEVRIKQIFLTEFATST